MLINKNRLHDCVALVLAIVGPLLWLNKKRFGRKTTIFLGLFLYTYVEKYTSDSPKTSHHVQRTAVYYISAACAPWLHIPSGSASYTTLRLLLLIRMPWHTLMCWLFEFRIARLHHYVGTYRKICLLVRIVPEDMPVSKDCGEHMSIFWYECFGSRITLQKTRCLLVCNTMAQSSTDPYNQKAPPKKPPPPLRSCVKPQPPTIPSKQAPPAVVKRLPHL